MNFKISTKNINTSYQYTNNKNSKTNSSFANQLNESKRNLSVADKNTSAPVYSNLGVLKNTVNVSKSSTDYSVDAIEKRRSEIHELQDFYEDHRRKYGTEGIERHNTKIMEKVLDLQIQNNKDIYYTNEKINLNKVAENCGISLNNATPLELESLRKELKDEGLIDEKTADGLESFISRIDDNTFLKTGCSYSDSYNNMRVDVLKEVLYFKDLDSCHDASSYSREIDDMILGMIK